MGVQRHHGDPCRTPCQPGRVHGHGGSGAGHYSPGFARDFESPAPGQNGAAVPEPGRYCFSGRPDPRKQYMVINDPGYDGRRYEQPAGHGQYRHVHHVCRAGQGGPDEGFNYAQERYGRGASFRAQEHQAEAFQDVYHGRGGPCQFPPGVSLQFRSPGAASLPHGVAAKCLSTETATFVASEAMQILAATAWPGNM